MDGNGTVQLPLDEPTIASEPASSSEQPLDQILQRNSGLRAVIRDEIRLHSQLDSPYEQNDGDGDTPPGEEPIDPELINQPVVPLGRRISVCYCYRCPKLKGEARQCCGQGGQSRCLSISQFVTDLLQRETAAERAAEATLRGKTINGCHRYHCYVECWDRFHERYQQWPRMKMPNCIEQRVHEAFPCDPDQNYTGFQYKRRNPDNERERRGRRVRRLC